MVWPPDSTAVPTVRPDASRITVRLPSIVALPVTRPALSRKVVRVPTPALSDAISDEAAGWLPKASSFTAPLWAWTWRTTNGPANPVLFALGTSSSMLSALGTQGVPAIVFPSGGLRETIHHTTEERQHFQGLIDIGFSDAFRMFEQPEKSYSWWDYREFAFRRNRGLLIDRILVSEALKPLVTGCVIDKLPRKNERPSDHTPVILEIF